MKHKYITIDLHADAFYPLDVKYDFKMIYYLWWCAACGIAEMTL